MGSRNYLGLILCALLPLPVSGAAATLDMTVAARVLKALETKYGPGASFSKVYVGSEACMACHQDKQDFRLSLHGSGLKTAAHAAYSMQDKMGIVADYDRNGIDDFRQGLDFNRINSAFDRYKPNAPVLGYSDAAGYTIRVGAVTYKVALVHGGSGLYKQRFLVKFPVTDRPGGLSAGTYYSPVQINEANDQYVVYEPTYWWDANNRPIRTGPVASKDAAAGGRSFDQKCAGCHSTALAVEKDALGEWISSAPPVVYADPNDPHYFALDGTGNKLSYNIGCERCHGAGSTHITNLGDKTKIVNPARDFTPLQQNELCGSCHGRGTSVPAGNFDYPYDEHNKVDYSGFIGEPLYPTFWKDAPGVWPDGKTSRQHHQQMQELRHSAKWEFPFLKMTCSHCHDPHNARPAHVRGHVEVEGAGGAKLHIATTVEDNSLCLSCHAGFGPFAGLKREDIMDMEKNRQVIAQTVSQHSHHPYDPASRTGLGRCTECHMAKMAASGAPYDMSSHTFEVVPPGRTLRYQAQGGMPNSCAARCHRVLAPLQGLPADPNLAVWNEASDVALAEYLQRYYGPNGTWWKTE